MIENATALIGTVGFPIFAFLLIYFDLRKRTNESTKAIKELTKAVSELRYTVAYYHKRNNG